MKEVKSKVGKPWTDASRISVALASHWRLGCSTLLLAFSSLAIAPAQHKFPKPANPLFRTRYRTRIGRLVMLCDY